MTTQNIHPENSDVDTSVVEHPPVSETTATPEGAEVAVPTTAQEAESQLPPTQAEVEQATTSQLPTTQAEVETPIATQPSETQVEQEEVVRPFTDFIAEFRQAEQQVEPFSSLISGGEQAESDFLAPWDTTPPESPAPIFEAVGTLEAVDDAAPSEYLVSAEGEPGVTGETFVPLVSEEEEQTLPAAQPMEEKQHEQTPAVTQPAIPRERPVSPLLRPAMPRMRRHGGSRQAGEFQIEEAMQPAQATSPVESTTGLEEISTQVSTPPESDQQQEQPRPARRYRFDRPAPAATPVAPMPTRTEESKDLLNRAPTVSPARTGNGHPINGQSVTLEREVEPQQVKQASGVPLSTEQQVSNQPASQETLAANGGTTATTTPAATPAAPTHDRRRRHGPGRQREKEQAAPVTPVTPITTPVTEVSTTTVEPPAAQEVALEDLPPLEYSELQAATSRRRRRRRASSAPATPAPNTPVAAKSTTSEVTPPAGTVPPPATVPSSPATAPRNVSVPGSPVSPPNQFNIVSGYTVNQMNQGHDVSGPFMGPEPSPARGNVGGSGIHNVRPIRTDTQRPPVYPVRTGEAGPSPASLNHFTNTVVQAIQAQTDRMVAELRRANQVPTNVSVSLPPFPSTERVGVFVDVANLLYSARTLRITVDFGKLLDFLRGNRRLVRAHAYTPTSPQPGDEQMFLQAVKGLGYRITTKNYKIFSSGAKKADLDLDLCMDVVRLVDGKAVDCIVLVSGDSDFMPMLDYCSDHGVRVEVAAFDEAMSATLRQSCDLFINLSMLDEIRA